LSINQSIDIRLLRHDKMQASGQTQSTALGDDRCAGA